MKNFSLEDAMRLGASHLEQIVDEHGRTYFDLFRTQPAEAVTDWPDFVDLPARYLEAAAMMESAGVGPVRSVPRLRRWLFSFIRQDGLAYRPDSPISNPMAELFDQSRLLYALVTLVMADAGDHEARGYLAGLLQGLKNKATYIDDYAYIEKIDVYYGGTLIRPLTQAAVALQAPEWLDLAAKITRGILNHSEHFQPDGSFKGHVHGHLGTAAGIIACGILKHDSDLIERGRKIFEYAHSISTDYGFVPELAQRDDDLIACETCSIMDYLDAALLLARHVDGRYWDVVDKVARNHLVESQVRDRDWLAWDKNAADEDGVIRSHLPERMAGGFAGWSAPHALLAYEEKFWPEWVRTEVMRPRYLGKVRAGQNCCSGGGIRALYQVWSNIAHFDGSTLNVNLLMDRSIPGATIVSQIPYVGRAAITVERDCDIRIFSGGLARPVQFQLDGKNITPEHDGVYDHIAGVSAGACLTVSGQLLVRSENIQVGNHARQQYHYTVNWRGNTVTEITPSGANVTAGYSRVEKRPVRVFAGADAPGLMYQRTAWQNLEVTPETGHTYRTGNLIDWYKLFFLMTYAKGCSCGLRM